MRQFLFHPAVSDSYFLKRLCQLQSFVWANRVNLLHPKQWGWDAGLCFSPMLSFKMMRWVSPYMKDANLHWQWKIEEGQRCDQNERCPPSGEQEYAFLNMQLRLLIFPVFKWNFWYCTKSSRGRHCRPLKTMNIHSKVLIVIHGRRCHFQAALTVGQKHTHILNHLLADNQTSNLYLSCLCPRCSVFNSVILCICSSGKPELQLRRPVHQPSLPSATPPHIQTLFCLSRQIFWLPLRSQRLWGLQGKTSGLWSISP